MLWFKEHFGTELYEKYLTRVEREQRKHALAESERRTQNLDQFAFGSVSLEPGLEVIFANLTVPTQVGEVKVNLCGWLTGRLKSEPSKNGIGPVT